MDVLEELKKLDELLKDGVISEDEFSSLKKKLLSKENEKDKLKSKIEENKEAVRILEQLDLRIDVDNLFYFITTNDLYKIELLLKAGVNPNEKTYDTNNFQSYPILIAFQFSNSDVAEFLIKYGADIKLTDQNGNTILHSAIFSGKIENVKTALEHGADIEKPAQENYYPIHAASLLGNSEIIELLVKYGADVNIQNINGYTCIYYAVESGKIENVKTLIKLGADINIVAEGYSILDYAKKRNKSEIAQHLKELGAESKLTLANKIFISLLSNKKKVSSFLTIGLFIMLFYWSSSGSNNKYSNSSPGNITHICSHCGKIRNGDSYSGLTYYTINNNGEITSSNIKNKGKYYNGYCSRTCAMADKVAGWSK